mmetsp:Transcript_8013/g.16169  ORF Transcript_8013/g.16169 Transcript_8013/m.16169 type:complete len:216 (-) Transcript_8013:526-1173(-)
MQWKMLPMIPSMSPPSRSRLPFSMGWGRAGGAFFSSSKPGTGFASSRGGVADSGAASPPSFPSAAAAAASSAALASSSALMRAASAAASASALAAAATTSDSFIISTCCWVKDLRNSKLSRERGTTVQEPAGVGVARMSGISMSGGGRGLRTLRGGEGFSSLSVTSFSEVGAGASAAAAASPTPSSPSLGSGSGILGGSAVSFSGIWGVGDSVRT